MKFVLKSKSHNNIKNYRCNISHNDVLEVMNKAKPKIFKLITDGKISLRIRFIICLMINFVKDSLDVKIYEDAYFCSGAERLTSSLEFDSSYSQAVSKILESINNFCRNGSGWSINKINFIDVNIGKYKSIRGGCSSLHIKLPDYFKNRRCLLNVKSENNNCFINCILAGIYQICRKRNRESVYRKYIKFLNFKRIKFPVKLSQIPLFEKLNGITVNIYSFDNDVYTLYRSKYQSKKIIDLFLYSNHYFLIIDFNKLLGYKYNRFFCRNCFQGYSRKSSLIKHSELCNTYACQKLTLPQNLELKFTSYEKMCKMPFVVYADFECYTTKLQYALPNGINSFTTDIEIHTPACFAFVVTNIHDEIVHSFYYSGDNVVNIFLSEIKKVVRAITKKLKINLPMTNISDGPYNIFDCFVCKKEFKNTDIICRDHCHVSSRFRGYSHSACNLAFKPNFYIPIVIHNLRGYDSHIILKHISTDLIKKINIIPVNMQKVLCFTIDNIKFVDSFLFLSSSLQKLVEILINNGYDFKAFHSFFSKYKYRNLLLRKGVFPYSYFSSPAIMSEQTLPQKEKFYNILTQNDISDSEYEHAQKVWNKFKCSKFADYVKIYQYTDVVLLAEVFNAFRKISLNYYELDAVNFFTTPDLTWHAGLKFINTSLQLLPDVDMYLMIEKGMRGGLTIIGDRYAKANNPYVKESFDESLPINYIFYADVINLYGFSLCDSLPINGFRWLNDKEISKLNITSLSSEDDVGYILEVDLSYPSYLHKTQNELPLAPSHLIIKESMLSPYQKRLLKMYDINISSNTRKLAPNFYDKQHYVVYSENLKYYLRKGLILQKIHRVLTFKRSKWLKPYIEFNNEKRKESSDEFHKSFFKLLNNAFFGKCCQNVRKRIRIKTALSKETCEKYLASPILENFQSVSDDLSMFQMKKTNLLLDKPIYVGFVVLELSKLHMYKIYYDRFKAHYNSNLRFCYSDTDSLILSIYTKNFYRDIKKYFGDLIDTSNYPSTHFLHSKVNANKLGYLKDETASNIITEFVALKPKMYSVKLESETKQTAKGVKKCVLASFTHDLYKNVLFNNDLQRHKEYHIVSKNHQLKTVLKNKISLSNYFDKKFIHADGIHTSSFGHFQTLENEDDLSD